MKKLVVGCVLLSMALSASAGIMIYPKALFFDDKTKSAEVSLINSSGLDSANYRVTVSYKKQNPDGSFTEIAEEEVPADSATKLLRYSPRSVMLKPSQSQTVRVLKRLPGNLEPGEYVAYITFSEVRLEKAVTKEDLKPGAFSVKITPIPAFSIPVFVRYKIKEGAPVTLTTNGVEEKDGYVFLRVVLNREPQEKRTSARGDITIWDGNRMVGLVRGRYMLPGTDSLETSIPLRLVNASVKEDGVREDKYLTMEEVKGKTLTVLFTEANDYVVQKDKVFAKTEVSL